MFGRRKRHEEPRSGASPDEIYRGLRTMALDAAARGLPSPSPEHPDVSGIIVDVPSSGGFATIVALTDRTTSMYTSVGGGVIGAGVHAEVADATRRLLEVTQSNLGLFKERDDHDMPPPGVVRFHLLTPSIGRRVDVPENAFWGRQDHQMMPVIARVQDVITAISAASPT